MRRKGLFLFVIGVIGIFALANAARQRLMQQPLLTTDQIIFEQSYTLNGRVTEDLIVLADTVTLSSDSLVEGDVALLSSSIQIDGRIEGDLTVLGEQVTIGPDARIAGNTTLLVEQADVAGTINRQLDARAEMLTLRESAQIDGTIYACADTLVTDHTVVDCDFSDLFSSTETLAALSDPNFVLPLLNVTVSGAAVVVLFSAFGSLALSGLSILAVVIFPRQISHIEEAIRNNPRNLGGTGLMIILLAVGITVALALVVVSVPPLGIILVPAYLLVALLFFGMVLTGWITITLITGDVLLRRVRSVHTLPPLIIAAVGNVSLLLVWNVLSLNDYGRICGTIVLVVLGAIGLGAAFITRMGTRPLHRSYLVQG